MRSTVRIALFCSAALGALAPIAAAQTAGVDGPAPAAVSDVVVTGKALSLRRSIAAKRDEPAIADVLSSDEVGSVPDFGLGEALQRAPGVSLIINNGRGEAQFMTLRGLTPDYNSVTVDGVALPSTETTRRQVSLDVLPSALASRVSLYKSAAADRPSDAIGGVTDLRTPSAFDHRHAFLGGRAELSYWDSRPQVHGDSPSGVAEITGSRRFGAAEQFGVVLQGSYMRRVSSSLDTATDTFSYYNYTGGVQTLGALRQSNVTSTSATLTPSDSVAGLTAVPDRHRWLTYDNVRERTGLFGKLDYRSGALDAHWTAGLFQHVNREHRNSQFLTRVGNATFTDAADGAFGRGQAQVDYDNFVQTRRLAYTELGAGYDFGPGYRLTALVNLAEGFYRQSTVENVFTQAASATLAFQFSDPVAQSALFTPLAGSTFYDASKYLQTYHMLRNETSKITVPTVIIKLQRHMATTDEGLGFALGVDARWALDHYNLGERRFNAVGSLSLQTVGVSDARVYPYNGAGQYMLISSPGGAADYFAANPQNYVAATTNIQNSRIGTFKIGEDIAAAYGLLRYRRGPWTLVAGVRDEHTRQDIATTQPSPLTSTTTYVLAETATSYDKPLPSVLLTYDVSAALKLRAGYGRTLGRPRYSDLAQSSAPSVSGATASQSVANPSLAPRTADNLDASLEWYPRRDIQVSVALFAKAIHHEIVRLTSAQTGVALPGLTGVYTLTTTAAQNTGGAQVQGIEAAVAIPRLYFLPGAFRYFGVTANAARMSMDASTIRMSDGTFRKLPQLLESAKAVANAALLFNAGPVSATLSYNHTGAIPITIDTNNVVNDLWYKPANTTDAQLRYALRPGLNLLAEAKNLTGEKPTRVIGPNQSLRKEELDNGRSYYLGVSFAY